MPPSPYPRRTHSAPKSSRQQFSACGACRMRRVRCDLKDLPPEAHTACSNCKERGLKCVDEFADVKTVKLLRRGRRLQQVEAIYGKVNGSESSQPSPPPSTIPQLHPEFFSSPFWHRFSIQRPIIDPVEFPSRFLAHVNDSRALSPEATIISMLLVVWAASFGLNERGVDQSDSDNEPLQDNARQRRDRIHAMLREVLHLIDLHGIMRRPTWDGVRVLLLISPLMEELSPPLDILTTYEATIAQVHALAIHAPSLSLSMHSPAPSGVNAYASDSLVKARVFWYAFFHEGITTALRGGRLVLDEDDLETFQNVSPAFTNGNISPGSSNFPTPISSGDGLLSHIPLNPLQLPQSGPFLSPRQNFVLTAHLFSLPLRLSAVCRKVHASLTGRDARRRAERGCPLDSNQIKEVWDGLDACWDEFENMRRGGFGISGAELEAYVGSWQIFIFECHNIVREALKQRIISPPGSDSPTSPFGTDNFSPTHPLSTPPSSATLSPFRLHALAMRRCLRLLPRVLALIKMHISAVNKQQGEAGSSTGTELFKWDAGLVGDGCFFAGFLAAGGEKDWLGGGACCCATGEVDGFGACEGGMGVGLCLGADMGMGMGMDAEEGVEVCLKALGEMRWAFAKGEEREQTIRMVWEANGRQGGLHGHGMVNDAGFVDAPNGMGGYRAHGIPHLQLQHLQHHQHTHHHIPPAHSHQQYANAHAMNHGARQAVANGIERPMLPPLSLSPSHPHSQPHTPPLVLDLSSSGSVCGSGTNSLPGSAPHTAGTDGSASGWPIYSPPGTGTSIGSAASGRASASGGVEGKPNVFQKSEELELDMTLPVSVIPVSIQRDGYYHHPQQLAQHRHQRGVDMEPFSYSAPVTQESLVVGVGYAQPHSIHQTGAYLDTQSFGDGFYECGDGGPTTHIGHKLDRIF